MKKRNGITLILVLLILTVLVILAVPFTFSMIYKEKTSKNFFFINQSRIAALGARNSAINLLLRTHSFNELGPNAAAPFDTPDMDTLAELRINIADLNITETGNSRGIIWSAMAEDEQGKLNLQTAPRRLIDELRDNILKPGDNIEHYVTNYSHRSTPWIAAQNLAGFMRYQAKDGNNYDTIYLDYRAPWANEEGLRVRLINGESEFIAYTASEPCPECQNTREIPDRINGVQNNHDNWIVNVTTQQMWRNMGSLFPVYLDRVVSDVPLNEDTIVEIEQPHPVNVNTASKEVLTALFTGVGYKSYGPGGIVTGTVIAPAQARDLADAIKQVNIGSPSELETFINNTDIIDAEQKQYLWLNAFYPRHMNMPNMEERKFAGTMPLCFRSFDVYTINSTGIVNYQSGNQAAVLNSNEIVDIAPLSKIIAWTISSQYDFDSQFYAFLGNPTKMTTYPLITNLGDRDSATASRNPDFSRAQGVGAVKLKTAEDNRGRNLVGQTAHFSDTYEGVNTPQDYPSNSIFQFTPDDTPFDIFSGGVEFWVKFNSVPAAGYLFDIKQRDYENRIALSYEANELILSVCDATVERKAAQIRGNANLQANVWYHIGAYWKGTKYAQMALLLDGRPIGFFGHYDDNDQKILTQLMADVPDLGGLSSSDDQITIPVASTTGFPPRGVIEIGAEVIEYDSISGNGFVVRTIWNRAVTPTMLARTGRGARETQILAHPAGAKVAIYGYSTLFNPVINIENYPAINLNPLPIGGARLGYDIPLKIDRCTVDEPSGSLSPTATSVIVSTTESLPEQGYVKIEDEVIFYESKGGKTLNNLSRGSLGTSAVNHFNGRSVELYSIRVDSTANYPSPTLVQIDDEWFGPLAASGEKPEYFTGVINGGRALDIWRGYVSGPITHYAGALLIPVLAPMRPTVGKDDIITIIEADQTTNPKEQKVVRNAVHGLIAPVASFVNNSPGVYRSLTGQPPNLFAFRDNLTRAYNVDGTTRLLKFPSDELPSYLPQTFSIGNNIEALVDEIKFMRSPRGNYSTNEVLNASNPDQTSVQFNAGSLEQSGVVKVGDEFIGYASTITSTLSDCKRGYLNTPVQTHDKNQRAINLSSFLPVSALAEDLPQDSNRITVTSNSGFGNSGYVLIGNDLNTAEAAGFNITRGNILQMPEHKNGIFRGMFGTTKQTHQQNTLCYAIPFRYWHLEKPNAFDNQMAFFQAATAARGANWKKIYWNETHEPSDDGLVNIRVLVRFDNKPAWDWMPTNMAGGIFAFDDPQGSNQLDITAEQAEIMVFFQYLPGAFFSNAWKRSPLLEDIYVDYEKPTLTLSKQEK